MRSATVRTMSMEEVSACEDIFQFYVQAHAGDEHMKFAKDSMKMLNRQYLRLERMEEERDGS